jgi:hypothetical protein
MSRVESRGRSSVRRATRPVAPSDHKTPDDRSHLESVLIRVGTEKPMSCFARNGTTLTVGLGFEPTGIPDRYVFRLRAKDPMEAPTADRRAARELRDYQRIERYSSFEVEGRSFNPTTSDFEYLVQYRR